MQRIGNNIIYAAIIALACFLPEVGFLVDGDILLKWYILGLNLCVAAFLHERGFINKEFELRWNEIRICRVIFGMVKKYYYICRQKQ